MDKKRQIKQLSKDSVIYGLGDALKRMVVFMLLPLYTRYLTPADYGRLELLMVTLNILFIISAQGMSTAFFRHYAFSKNELQRTELISTSYYYMIFSSFIVCGLLYQFSEPMSKLLFDESKSCPLLIKIIVFTGMFQTMSLIPFQLFRAKLQPVKYVTVSITGFLLQVALNVYFVVVLKIGINGVLLGNAISALLIVIVNVFLIKNSLILKFSFSRLKDLLKFGLPLISVGIFTWVMQFSDKYLLQKFASIHDVGLYSFGSRFANILTLVFIGPFAAAWGAYCFQIAATDNAKESFKTITTYFMFVLSFLGIGLIVLSPLVIKLIASAQFLGAHKVVMPLVCANMVYSMFYTLGLGINIVKKTHYYAYIMCMGAALNVILNITFIPKYGMLGAGFVSFVCYLVIMSVTYCISQKLYYIPFEKGRLLKLFSIFISITACAWMLQMPGIFLDISFRVFLLFSFVLSLYFVKFFRDKEMGLIKKYFYNVLHQKGLVNKIKLGYQLIKAQ